MDDENQNQSLGKTFSNLLDDWALMRPKSELYEVNCHYDPLIAAALPLLTLTSEIIQSKTTPDFNAVFQMCCDEIKVMEDRVQDHALRLDNIHGARYLLCALIDETIIKKFGKTASWEKSSLLQTFQRESWQGERFYIIIDRALLEDQKYRPLLELAYYCLSLGYQGNASLETRSLLMDKIYQLIKFPKKDFVTFVENPQLKMSKKNYVWLPPIWLTLFITLGLVALIWLPYHSRLTEMGNSIIKQIQLLGQ